MSLWVNEAGVNATEHYGMGESGVYDTGRETLGEIYRDGLKYYGRCTGKVYVDGPDGKPKQVGWTFLKRARYEDTHEFFLQETWLTVHTGPDTVVRTPHYADFGGE